SGPPAPVPCRSPRRARRCWPAPARGPAGLPRTRPGSRGTASVRPRYSSESPCPARSTGARGPAGCPCSRSCPAPGLPILPRARAGARVWPLRVRSAPASRLGLAQRLGALLHFFDRPLHPERLLGKFVVLAVGDLFEALDGVLQADVLAGEAGEL